MERIFPIRIHPWSFVLLGFLSAIPLMKAAEDPLLEFEEAIHHLYEDLSADFRGNEFFTKLRMNSLRDGIASPFMLSFYPGYKWNNARKLSSLELDRIPEFEMLSESLFRRAVIGHQKLLGDEKSPIHDSRILTVIDFGRPSKDQRLYVFDLSERRVLFNTWVAHGFQSDRDRDTLPETFSNTPGSNQSSLGFFVTDLKAGRTPSWRHGLKVSGLDPDLNSNARARAIIFHELGSIDPSYVASPHALPATEGCFGLPGYDSGRFYGLSDLPLNDLILNRIEGGSVVYVESPIENMPMKSQHLNRDAAAKSYEQRRSFTIH